MVGWLVCGLTSKSTIFQSCWDKKRNEKSLQDLDMKPFLFADTYIIHVHELGL